MYRQILIEHINIIFHKNPFKGRGKFNRRCASLRTRLKTQAHIDTMAPVHADTMSMKGIMTLRQG
jgi:hypothetical protein